MTTHIVKLPSEAAKVLKCMQHGAGLRAHRTSVAEEHIVTLQCFQLNCTGVGNVHRGTLDALIRRGIVDAKPLDKFADVIAYELSERGKVSTSVKKIEDGQADWAQDICWTDPSPNKRRRRA